MRSYLVALLGAVGLTLITANNPLQPCPAYCQIDSAGNASPCPPPGSEGACCTHQRPTCQIESGGLPYTKDRCEKAASGNVWCAPVPPSRSTEFYAEISGISLAAFEANINGTIQNEFNFEIAVTATLNSAINSTEIHSDDVGIGADIGPGRDPAKAASTVGFTASVTTHAWQDFKSMQAEVHENTEHFQAALTAELRKFPAFKDARVTVLEPADPTTPAPPTTAAPGGGPAAAPGGGGGGGSSSGASAGTIGGAAAAALGVALVGLAVQRRQQRKFRREQQASAAVAELEEGAGAAEDAAAAAALNKPLLETSGCQTDRLIVEPAPTTTPEEPEQVWERQGTEVSVLQRQRESGATLVSKRLHIVGKGTGVVIGTVQAKGRKTRHTVQFADGRKETVLLQKQSNQRDGDKFYVEELVDTTE